MYVETKVENSKPLKRSRQNYNHLRVDRKIDVPGLWKGRNCRLNSASIVSIWNVILKSYFGVVVEGGLHRWRSSRKRRKKSQSQVNHLGTRIASVHWKLKVEQSHSRRLPEPRGHKDVVTLFNFLSKLSRNAKVHFDK